MSIDGGAGSGNAIDVDVAMAEKTYTDMETSKDELANNAQQLDGHVANMQKHWHSDEKAPPFHHAMDEIKTAFDGQVKVFMEHIEHSRADLKQIAGF